MNREISKWFLAGASLALAAAPAWCAPAETPLTEGARAPGFALLGSDGKAHGLAGHRGKEAVVLAFYPKAFTGG